MIQFPESTYYGKRIPKEKFYSHLEVSATIKQSFVNDIEQIVWLNKLSATTLNLAASETVKEIALLEVSLKTRDYNKQLFQFIDRNIPLYVVYLLHFGSEEQLLVNYKESIVGKPNSFKLTETYITEWAEEHSLKLKIQGLNLDALYESFVWQIAGDKLQSSSSEVELKETIVKTKEIEKTEKQIVLLESLKRKEKQFNKQLEIAAEIKKLKK